MTPSLHRCSADEVPLVPKSVQTIVTSPPYWGKRVYGDSPDEIGAGQSLLEYCRSLTLMARHWRSALVDDGIMWINLGDTYAGSGGAGGDHRSANGSKRHMALYRQGSPLTVLPAHNEGSLFDQWGVSYAVLKGGQLCFVPALVAMHLQGDGWLVRSSIVWDRGVNRPEDMNHVKRPLDGRHEMILMVTKQKAVKFYGDRLPKDQRGTVWNFRAGSSIGAGGKDGHVAPFPDELPRRCIVVSTDPGDLVFDPFAGSGTTLRVAESLGRNAVGCDLYAGENGFA